MFHVRAKGGEVKQVWPLACLKVLDTAGDARPVAIWGLCNLGGGCEPPRQREPLRPSLRNVQNDRLPSLETLLRKAAMCLLYPLAGIGDLRKGIL